MTIRSKLILAFLAVSLSTMILISLLFYSNEKKNLTHQIFNHLQSVASIQQNRIKAINHQNIARLKIVASRTQLRVILRDYIIDSDPYHLERLSRNIADAKASLTDFKNICIVSLKGIILASTEPTKIGKNVSQKDFFIQGQTEYSGDHFFLNKDQNLMTHLSGPLILNGQLLGVLAIESGVENIISSVNDFTGLGKTGETILALRLDTGDAQFIIPTRFDPAAALKRIIPGERLDIPIIQAFLGKSNILTDAVDYREVPVLAVTRYIKNPDWGLVVKIDLAEALAPVRALRNLIALIIFLSTIVIVFISLYLSKNITRPIVRLTDTARKISDGDYDVLADESGQDETGILASAFNKMTANLIQSRQKLEIKIHELSESEEQIRNLLNSTAEAILGIDKNGNCTFCNPSCLRLLGYKKNEDLIGKNVHQLIHHTRADGKDYPNDECEITGILKNKNPVHVNNEVLWKADGTSFWAEYRAYPVIRKDEIIGAVVTFFDITEQKQALVEKEKLNTQLQQAQKMEAIGTLAGGIAHDFNNILAAMLGYTELVQMKTAGQENVESDIDQVIQAGNRAKELVRQILAFSRQTKYERRPVEMYFIVKEALKLLRASIPTTIEIKTNIETSGGTILGEPTQIHQVLMNLCTNAYQAMREKGGTLTVTLSRIEILPDNEAASGFVLTPGPYSKLQITDTGDGMDRAIMARIFEPYFTTKNKKEGTGMGLALTHGIVREHDGHITVSSEPGKGAVFTVFLPIIVIDPPKGPVVDDPESLLGGSERILFVDDEEGLVLMEQQILGNLGYQVTAVTSSIEALQRFIAGPDDFDLIITDMTMPQMTGAELARKILDLRPDIPIILCTGFSDLINEQKARAIGIREYVMKPIVTREIVSVIRKLMDET